MRWLYNILFSIVFWVASPWLLLRLSRRGEWREAFGQRFGRYRAGALPARSPGSRRIWVHAVSVGEVNTCLQFVRCLQEQLPAAQVIVSTTTNTGMAELRRKRPGTATPVYFPVDLQRCARRALDAIRPDAVLLAEREIWPNFLWQLKDRSIPVFLVNARISERSHRSYSRFRFLFHDLYAQFDLVTAQTDMDAQRLREVGCRSEVLHVLGSMKFDASQSAPPSDLNVRELMTRAGRKPGAPVLVGGSTHAGEEALLAALAQRLRGEFPDLFLVLVPRHFERCGEVFEQLRAAGVTPVLRSALGDPSLAPNPRAQTLLVDSTGELTAFYAESDVVFVGKSLCAQGGQNPIEPAAQGKALVLGPHMQNFAGVTRQLVAADAALQVGNESELEKTLAALLRSPVRRQALGDHALAVVRESTGAARRTATLTVEKLAELWDGGTGGVARPGS